MISTGAIPDRTVLNSPSLAQPAQEIDRPDGLLKFVPNEMQNFGSVHVRSSLSLRRSEERLTHAKRMILQLKVKRKSEVLLDFTSADS